MLRTIQSLLIFALGVYLGIQFGGTGGIQGIAERLVSMVEQLEGRR
jgi:hypothetical protein